MKTMSRLFAVAVVAAVAACSSAPVPIDTFYRLEPRSAPVARAGGPIKGVAEVTPLRGEGVINERAILYRAGTSRLRQYSYHFWADTPAAMLQRDLIDALRNAKAFERVVTPELRLNRDYEISGTIRKLEHDVTSGSRAVMEIELAVRKINGNQIVLMKTYSAELSASDDEVSAAVDGFAGALSQIIAAFIADLSQIPG
ncbi:MAG: ABC-type transport auxiliary lipoprotein family protein [Rhodospirillaceae bacterium]|nr:ABC-type transport auxiliary lipoprotein family protein [Rhodospirillaceae bacterium]